MTPEEAQELIAEIGKMFRERGVCHEFYNKEVEKIITRFANKPIYISTWSNKGGELKIRSFIDLKLFTGFVVEFDGYPFALSIEEAKELRENLDKMLKHYE